MPHVLTNFELPTPGLHVLGPPRPRRSRRRQFVTLLCLLLLVSIICAYWVITDPGRVRPMAEHYLSKIVGGRVKVHKAHLSLFEGLRLEGVDVFVGDGQRPDSNLFSARTFLVRPNLRALLGGRLEATQIMALDPHVRLCENVDADESRRWNYLLLSHDRTPRQLAGPDQPIALPEIVLRGGMIEYSRITNGRYEPLGSMAIDGQLNPDPRSSYPNRYLFELDSRGPGEPAGPHISGSLDMDVPSVSASLRNFEFNRTLRAVLPAQVQAWWQSHQLSGRIRIPRFQFIPGKPGSPHSFHIEVQLDRVDLAVLPEELLGSDDYQQISRLRPCIRTQDPPDIGLVSRIDTVEHALQLRPVFLTGVSGRLVFTPDQIRISGISGKIENNNVLVDGAIYGYSDNAPASLRLIASNLQIPRQPRYIASLPHVVRKIYSDFMPAGRASLFFEIRRDKPGGKLKTTGEVVIHDGAFCFSEFPYPLRGVTGTLTIGPDRAAGQDRLDLINLRGVGLEGSPNATNAVTVNGFVSPIDRGSAVEIRVASPDVSFDQHVRAALPSDPRSVIDMFDMRDRSGAPDPPVIAPVELRGSFEAHIRRPPGPKKKTTAEVDLNIAYGRGEFVGFPYPLRNVTGRISVRPRYTIVKDLIARHGDSMIRVDGRVDYGPNRPTEPLLDVSALNIPLDNDLLSSLPTEQRHWLEKGGLAGGLLDIAGNIVLPPNATTASKTDFNLSIALRNGKIWPVANTFALTDVAAQLRLSRTGLVLEQLTGKRGAGQLTGRGNIAWPDDQPQFDINATILGVALDEVFYQIIPNAAQRVWNLLRPKGATDLQITYKGGITPTSDATTQPAASAESYTVTIRPTQLAISPTAFPWAMENITGTILVTPDKTTFQDVAFRHGPATLKLNGVGSGTRTPRTRWDLSLSAQSIPFDDSFRSALGDPLRTFCDSIKLQGALSLECPKLTIDQVDPPAPADPGKPAPAPITQIQIQDAAASLADGSLDTGPPLTAINGGIRDLSITLHDSTIRSLSAKIDVPSLQLAQRPAKDFRGSIKKLDWPGLAGHNIYRFEDLQAKVAGGLLSLPQLDIDTPDKGPGTYGLRLDLKDIDLRTLDIDENVHGRLNASLNLQAKWNDPASRIGGGNVLIQGKELHELPIVFGWLQIANLAMPVKSPFTEATAVYHIRGQKISLERMALRTSSVIMQGTGSLDFASKRMEMTFLTYNPGLPRIPILADLIDVAKRELLPIHVTGTISEPKVKVKSLNTFTTTIDKVFDDRPKNKTAKPKRPEKPAPGRIPLSSTKDPKP